MTEADRESFAKAFTGLKLAFGDKDADVVKMRTYFNALLSLQIEFVEKAAKRLMTESRFFPTVNEWQTRAATIARESKDAHTAMLRRLPESLCRACGDTGWAPSSDDRVRRCECQELRRLEILGRRPWPTLAEEATPPTRPTTKAEGTTSSAEVARCAGSPSTGPRVMPGAKRDGGDNTQ